MRTGVGVGSCTPPPVTVSAIVSAAEVPGTRAVTVVVPAANAWIVPSETDATLGLETVHSRDSGLVYAKLLCPLSRVTMHRETSLSPASICISDDRKARATAEASVSTSPKIVLSRGSPVMPVPAPVPKHSTQCQPVGV